LCHALEIASLFLFIPTSLVRNTVVHLRKELIRLIAILSVIACSVAEEQKVRSVKPSEEHIKAMLTALTKGDVASAKAEFGDTVDPNFTFADQKTLISASAAIGNVEITRYLLEIGADPKKGDKRGMTPLHYAALYGRDTVIAVLIKAGASVNARDSTGLTPLHCAATGDSESTVQVLMENGADPQLKDRFGSNPEKTASLNDKPNLASLIRKLAK
jgi:Ankyrin repeats (3 copies)